LEFQNYEKYKTELGIPSFLFEKDYGRIENQKKEFSDGV
jgi:hypothetical protein